MVSKSHLGSPKITLAVARMNIAIRLAFIRRGMLRGNA